MNNLLVLTVFVSLVGHGASYGESLPDAKELVGYFKNATLWNNSVSMRLHVEMNIESQLRKSANRTYNMVYRRNEGRTEWYGKTELLYNDKSIDNKASYEFVQVMNDKFHLGAEKKYISTEFRGYVERDFKQLQNIFLTTPEKGGFLDGTIDNIGETLNISDLLYESGNLSVIGKEVINDDETYIVESTTLQGKTTAWISPKKGYNALKYSIEKNSNDIIKDNITVEQEGCKYYNIVVDSIEFQIINNIYIPVSGRYARHFQGLDGKEETVTYTVKRSEIDLKPDFDALGAFKFHLPDGSKVEDLDNPGISFQVVGENLVADVDNLILDVIENETQNLVNIKSTDSTNMESNAQPEITSENKKQTITKNASNENIETEKTTASILTHYSRKHLLVAGLFIITTGYLIFYIYKRKHENTL